MEKLHNTGSITALRSKDAPRINTAISNDLCAVVLKALPNALRDFLLQLEPALAEQSIRATSYVEAQACTEFQQICRHKGETAIERTLEAICTNLPLGASAVVPINDDASAWNLVDDTEIDDLLDAHRLVRGLRETLGALEKHNISCLNRLSNAQPRDSDHPLALEFLVRKLQQGLLLRQQTPTSRSVFLNTALQIFPSALKDYLQALAAVFKSHQIEPLAAPHKAMRPRGGQVHAIQPSGDAAYQALQHLRQAQQPGAHLQQATTEAQVVPPTQLLNQIGSQLTKTATGGVAMAQLFPQLEAQGYALSAHQREDATLVGDLFNALEQEPNIARGVKPALRRLLIPVLQAALQDPAAFADPNHPVRATLDRFLRLCDTCDPPNRVLEARLDQLTQHISQSYDGDPAVFSQADQELNELLAIQQRAYRNNAERVMQLHRGRDTLAKARQHLAKALAELFPLRAPKVLLDWLDAGWQELLVNQLIRDGENSFGLRSDMALTALIGRWLEEGQQESGPAEQVARAYEVDHLLGILRRRMESAMPGQYQYAPLLEQLQRQLLGEEPVEFCAPPSNPSSAATAPIEQSKQRWLERIETLKQGDRFLSEKGQALQLAWCNPEMDRYVLVDNQGRETATFAAGELIEQLADGTLEISDESHNNDTVIQKTLQDIVGRLYHEIAHVRSHDELTGLLNRRSFEVAVAQCLSNNKPHVFLMLHIDSFILLNHKAGREAGDACLVQFAETLTQIMPATAQVARLDGVDFAVTLPDQEAKQALALAEKLRVSIEKEGFTWKTQHHHLSLSIGLVEGNAHHDVANILCDLSTATSYAKERGRNRVHRYQPEDDRENSGLLDIAARVDDIVLNEELSLRLQLIAPTSPASDELPHYELLLVMENELLLLDFITAAERYQRMPKVDRWVLSSIFKTLHNHPEVWQHSSSISINLSGSSLNDDRLLGFIESLFEQYEVAPERICFEITETAAVASLAKTADLVRQLQKAGCTFSIDDFGVGYSSFDYLKRLPVDYVKIDGSFVKEIENSPSDLAMVKSINEIAHALGRKTIAEFVESASIREQLKLIGVDYVQGYGVEKPKPLSQWLQTSA